ncbi:hypothetical protein imdm_1573 [gamma proteobacterium IMCC2047]|nr:hypothetical protein imdm_1573 [gamma proteobacterium IMCC2047]
MDAVSRGEQTHALSLSTIAFICCFAIVLVFMTLGKVAVYKHIRVYCPDYFCSLSGALVWMRISILLMERGVMKSKYLPELACCDHGC